MIAVALGLVAALSWGTADFAARFSGRAIGPALTLLLVTLTGSGLLGLWLAVIGPGLPAALSLPAFLYGLFSLIGTLALYQGLARAPICTVAPMAAAYPAWSLAYMAAFDGLRPNAWQLAAMALVIAGVMVVARAAKDETAEAEGRGWHGPVLGLAAGMFFGFTLVSGLHATEIHGQVQALWLARTVGVVMMLPTLWLARGQALPAPRWIMTAAGQGVLDSLAFMSVLAAGAPQDAAIASVVSSSFGIVTIALARLFLKERVVPAQWGGIVLTFAGVTILSALG